MTPDDLRRLKMIKYYLMFWLNPLSRETKEKCENFTTNTPYQWTSRADNSSKRGVGTITTLHQNDPWTLLYNFYYQSWALEWRPRHFLDGSAQKVPFSDLPRTQNCLRSWSKHVDMNSHIESLDELNNQGYKKNRKNTCKKCPILDRLTYTSVVVGTAVVVFNPHKISYYLLITSDSMQGQVAILSE